MIPGRDNVPLGLHTINGPCSKSEGKHVWETQPSAFYEDDDETRELLVCVYCEMAIWSVKTKDG